MFFFFTVDLLWKNTYISTVDGGKTGTTVFLLFYYFGVVWMAMGGVFISRKSCKMGEKMVKSPKYMPTLTFPKAVQCKVITVS